MLKYGKGAIAGHPAEDRACFGPNSEDCLTKLNFLNVFNSKDLSSLQGSGLIGLAPTPAKERKGNQDPLATGIDGFVAQIKKNPEFTEKYDQMFSFYLSHKTNINGKMLFGGYDMSLA